VTRAAGGVVARPVRRWYLLVGGFDVGGDGSVARSQQLLSYRFLVVVVVSRGRVQVVSLVGRRTASASRPIWQAHDRYDRVLGSEC
jgi:hypothetical protein